MAESDRADQEAPDTVTIKKYANRRLYNTATSSYVTLDNLCDMVRNGEDFVVRDARSGGDITRQVLTQIIVEQEAKGQNMLPISFLRQLIQLYGDNVQAFVPRYLEVAMDTFARNQGRHPRADEPDLRRHVPGRRVRSHGRAQHSANAAHHGDVRGRSPRRAADGAEARDGEPVRREADVDAVLDRLDKMQAQLDALSGRSPKGWRTDD